MKVSLRPSRRLPNRLLRLRQDIPRIRLAEFGQASRGFLIAPLLLEFANFFQPRTRCRYRLAARAERCRGCGSGTRLLLGARASGSCTRSAIDPPLTSAFDSAFRRETVAVSLEAGAGVVASATVVGPGARVVR